MTTRRTRTYLEIRFAREQRVQIFVRGRPGDSMNFADMGFEDRRGGGGKPILAWALLVALSQNQQRHLPGCESLG